MSSWALGKHNWIVLLRRTPQIESFVSGAWSQTLLTPDKERQGSIVAVGVCLCVHFLRVYVCMCVNIYKYIYIYIYIYIDR